MVDVRFWHKADNPTAPVFVAAFGYAVQKTTLTLRFIVPKVGADTADLVADCSHVSLL